MHAGQHVRIGAAAGRFWGIGCTAAQAVAAASWQAEWAIPSRRADQGRDCGAAEIQRVAENAPRWPDMNAEERVFGGSRSR